MQQTRIEEHIYTTHAWYWNMACVGFRRYWTAPLGSTGWIGGPDPACMPYSPIPFCSGLHCAPVLFEVRLSLAVQRQAYAWECVSMSLTEYGL